MQDMAKCVITQKEVVGYSREELLTLLKKFEGPGLQISPHRCEPFASNGVSVLD